MTLTALALAVLIGLGMGVLGAGGSLVAVPALSFLLHFPPKEAVVTSLAIVGVAAAAGATAGLVRGAIPISIAISVGASAMAGAYAGGRIGALLPDRVQLIGLALMMFVAAAALLIRPSSNDGTAPPARMPMQALLGVAIGVVTGLLGVGGGFLIVPALVIGGKLPMHRAAAVSLFVIALAAFAAIPGYLGTVSLNWPFIVPFAGVAAVAAIAGGMLGRHVPQRRLQQGFAAALVVLGSLVLVRA